MFFSKPCWFVNDVCGIICMIFGEFLLLYASLVLNFLFIPTFLESGKVVAFVSNIIFYNLLFILSSLCHLITTTTDPGVMPNGDDKGEIILPIELQSQSNSIRSCIKCNNLKPPRTHHCSVCKRCVFMMDHHCPWVNNCVGVNNQKQFLLFLFYIFLFSVYSLTLICYCFYSCFSYPDQVNSIVVNENLVGTSLGLSVSVDDNLKSTQGCSMTPVMLIFGFTVIVESLIFGIFCIAMLIDQIICIVNNTTGIEHLKQEFVYRKKKGAYLLFSQVFGGKFSWRWFLPTKTRSSFRTNNFDISSFLDIEFGDFNLDPEYGSDDFDQVNSNKSRNNMTMERHISKNKSGRVNCCSILRSIEPTSMMLIRGAEDFSILETEENEIERLESRNAYNKNEIKMDDLQNS
ncbi:DHHC family palmitoyl transferase fused to a KOW domain [Cryptosporidium bovis]|uniref:DHHC family palmitoyl transferase fused to a KOW domain n=1 Tax=Cryptosporidium bovis TaxID=310047 RepID=UPI00351A6AFB|nr:DHHC family palmitoyl transferase fused to a KOW domain [Cryptosporidium bovis]